jgi:hypothetical protein
MAADPVQQVYDAQSKYNQISLLNKPFVYPSILLRVFLLIKAHLTNKQIIDLCQH